MTPEIREMLVQAAIEARQHAYVPYSGYQVGAALLTQDGQVVRGCNIENAAYSPCICAERTALAKAVSEGIREFTAIAVVTDNGGSPCGVCRQMLYEFAPNMDVIIADGEGKVYAELSLTELLPRGFGPEYLK
jgi:cytidine deaminase